MGTTKGIVPRERGGIESMNLHNTASIFAAGFLATSMLFSSLTAGASAMGFVAMRAPAVLELVVSLIGGAAATALIGRSKS